MVETITPVVHGGRRGRWATAVALHIAGAAIGAAALGAVLGVVGRVLGAPWGSVGAWFVVAVAAAYAARELLGAPLPLPDRKRQVPEWWRTFFGPLTASFLYGLGLGVGFLTYLRHGTLVAVAALAIVAGEPVTGALVVLPFGLARALTVIAAAPGVTSDALGAVMARLDAWALSAIPRLVNGALLVAVAMAVALGPVGVVRTTGPSLAAELLGVVFVWAALAKLTGFPVWRRDLEAYRLPGRTALAVVIPVAELAVPALVVAGFGTAAAALALVLLASFSGAILRARRLLGDRLPCGCFGGRDRRDFRVLLVRNAALGALALASFDDPVAAVPGVGSAEAIPLLLIGLGIGLAVLLGREALRLAGGGTP